jgi:hypothetical protein
LQAVICVRRIGVVTGGTRPTESQPTVHTLACLWGVLRSAGRAVHMHLRGTEVRTAVATNQHTFSRMAKVGRTA